MKIFISWFSALALVVSPINAGVFAREYIDLHAIGNMQNIAQQDNNKQDESDLVNAQAQKELLPDSIDSSLSATDTVISEKYVATSDGQIVEAETGKPVVDEKIVGTVDTPPDPLAKTNGQGFIPVSVEAARQVVEGQDFAKDSSQVDSSRVVASSYRTSNSSLHEVSNAAAVQDFARVSVANVAPISNWSSEYGAYWGQYNGEKAFFAKNGSLFASPAQQVIDVSEWQKEIDWAAVKASGVDAAVIRVGYGTKYTDKFALRNISECIRLGIPFGVYLYSYASNGTEGWQEADNVFTILQKAGISNSDAMKLPIFYDLEAWTYTGHTHPTSPAVYDEIVNHFFMSIYLHGYSNVSVYSYTSYLNSALKSTNIHSRTNWVADYGPSLKFPISSKDKGWQYSSGGAIDGIAGRVDINAFHFESIETSVLNSYPLVDIPNGEYYINASMQSTSSIDFKDGKAMMLSPIVLNHYNHSSSQKFLFEKNSDGSYNIINSASGLALDVFGGTAQNLGQVGLYTKHHAKNQQWFIRDTGTGYMIQSALGHYVLDINNRSTQNGTAITMYRPNSDSVNQRFMISSTTPILQGETTIRSVVNGYQTIGIAENSTNLGAYAEVNYVDENGSDSQTFVFNEIGNGVYTIKNVKSQQVLDVYNGKTDDNTPVIQYFAHGGINQQWSVIPYANGQIGLSSFSTGKVLTVNSDRAASYSKLSITSRSSLSLQQKWAVYPAYRGLADGIYTIRPAHDTSMALDVYGGYVANETNVQIYHYHGGLGQRWRVTHDSNGNVVITSVLSGKALDVYGGQARDTSNIQIYTAHNGDGQKWKLDKKGQDTFILESLAGRNQVMDIYGGFAVAGRNVQTYTKHGMNGQLWRFYRLS